MLTDRIPVRHSEPPGVARRPDRAPDPAAVKLAHRGQLARQPAPIPPCPERDRAPQCPDGLRVRCCAVCGRVTARLDGDGVGWCGGTMPTTTAAGRPVRHRAVVA